MKNVLTWESMLSLWNSQIFPSAETALSVAITLSAENAVGWLIISCNFAKTSGIWMKELQVRLVSFNNTQNIRAIIAIHMKPLTPHLERQVWIWHHQIPHIHQSHKQQPETNVSCGIILFLRLSTTDRQKNENSTTTCLTSLSGSVHASRRKGRNVS